MRQRRRLEMQIFVVVADVGGSGRPGWMDW
jgi:hypothetical protein